MEHLNKIAKGAIRFLGSNKTEKAIQRVGQANGTLPPDSSSVQKKKNKTKKDIEVVVLELVKANCLIVSLGKINRGNTCDSHAPKPPSFQGQKGTNRLVD